MTLFKRAFAVFAATAIWFVCGILVSVRADGWVSTPVTRLVWWLLMAALATWAGRALLKRGATPRASVALQLLACAVAGVLGRLAWWSLLGPDVRVPLLPLALAGVVAQSGPLGVVDQVASVFAPLAVVLLWNLASPWAKRLATRSMAPDA